MTMARKELVDLELTRYYHCLSRCVRGAFLCGEGFEHRKQWVESRVETLAGSFAISVCGFSVMDNHLHLLLRLDPGVAEKRGQWPRNGDRYSYSTITVPVPVSRPPMHPLKIALAQVKQTGVFEENAAAILRFVDQAGEQGVEILCFPETQTVGYRVDISDTEAPVPVEKLEALHLEVADRCRHYAMACILGTEIPLPENPTEGKPYNSALVISKRGEILGAHHKTRLTPLDAVAYSPGESIETFDLCGVRVGVVICFEGFRFAETTAECVRQGAQLVFHPQNNTTRANDWKIPIHHAMIVTRAAENTIWFASCNPCLLPHQNCRSMVVAPDGQIHAQSELKREELLVTEIDIDRATGAMFHYDLENCAEILFSDTVAKEEYTSILPQQGLPEQ